MIVQTNDGFVISNVELLDALCVDNVNILKYIDIQTLNRVFISSYMEVDLGVEEIYQKVMEFINSKEGFYINLMLSIIYYNFDINQVIRSLELDNTIDYVVVRYVTYVIEEVKKVLQNHRGVNISSWTEDEIVSNSLFMDNNSYWYMRNLNIHETEDLVTYAIFLTVREVGND